MQKVCRIGISTGELRRPPVSKEMTCASAESAGGVLAGSLVGVLPGTKTRMKIGTNALTYGGTAVLGWLAQHRCPSDRMARLIPGSKSACLKAYSVMPAARLELESGQVGKLHASQCKSAYVPWLMVQRIRSVSIDW